MHPILPLALLLLLSGCARDDVAPDGGEPARAAVADDAPDSTAAPGFGTGDETDSGNTPAGAIDAATGSAATADAGATPDAAAAPAPTVDELVHADDTLASLRARLGAGNVVAGTLAGAEGSATPGWTLFPGDPARRLSVYLDDRGLHPMLLLADRQATAWTRADGVRIGMTSQELARLNGGPFAFMGFDWDYGGVVTDWRGGRLAPNGASAGPVTLCRPEGVAVDDYPVGDREYPSDDARLLVTPALVCQFGVNVDPPVAAAG